MPQKVKSQFVVHQVNDKFQKRYFVDSNLNLQLEIIDISIKNTDTKIEIMLHENSKCNLNLYILNKSVKKNILVQINHESNTQSNVNVKAFSSNGGNIKINLINVAPKGKEKIEQNQSINGVIFDERSQINVTPSMLIDTNVIKATHAVNIGNINPEQLFYLMSRGINKSKATIMILKGMFSALANKKTTQNLYNKAIVFLNKMIKRK
ncbi:MAG: SufD family Fe-S cluster assembly protein [Mycoplasmataceae bacterium]|jgi:Fe-S cluster assembly protein SufD|nr:SufD family Fe-S cluster assembly protein [Mycoplasmataceae bacterium]